MASHLVEFYETDSLLVKSVTDFLEPAIKGGDPVILVATAAHRASLIYAMAAAGLAVDAARTEGRFVDLDAADILSRLMSGSAADLDKFQHTIGGLVHRLGAGTSNLRIYGEMVAMLWRAGQRSAALQLEGLWNKMQAERPFDLLCAYPVSCIGWGVDTTPFRSICSAHSGVELRLDVPETERSVCGSIDVLDSPVLHNDVRLDEGAKLLGAEQSSRALP